MSLPILELFPANMRRWPNVGLLLGQRRRRWANSKSTLGQRLMFAGKFISKPNKHGTLILRWFDVEDGGQTSSQHSIIVSLSRAE